MLIPEMSSSLEVRPPVRILLETLRDIAAFPPRGGVFCLYGVMQRHPVHFLAVVQFATSEQRT